MVGYYDDRAYNEKITTKIRFQGLITKISHYTVWVYSVYQQQNTWAEGY